jgi:hypothetical protein
VFVGGQTVADVTYGVALIRLENLAREGWLAAAAGDAYGEWGRGLARVGPLGPTSGLSRLVDVRLRPVVTYDRLAVLPLRWEAVGPGGGLFPVLDADITLAPHEEPDSLAPHGEPDSLAPHGEPDSLAPHGEPDSLAPLGAIGAALDRVVLRRVATATIQGFVDRIGNTLADPAAAAAPETADGALDCLGYPLEPGQA